MQVLLDEQLYEEIQQYYKIPERDRESDCFLIKDIHCWAYQVREESREHRVSGLEPGTPIFEFCKANEHPFLCILNIENPYTLDTITATVFQQ